jgi:hypothetical protein
MARRFIHRNSREYQKALCLDFVCISVCNFVRMKNNLYIYCLIYILDRLCRLILVCRVNIERNEIILVHIYFLQCIGTCPRNLLLNETSLYVPSTQMCTLRYLLAYIVLGQGQLLVYTTQRLVAIHILEDSNIEHLELFYTQNVACR